MAIVVTAECDVCGKDYSGYSDPEDFEGNECLNCAQESCSHCDTCEKCEDCKEYFCENCRVESVCKDCYGIRIEESLTPDTQGGTYPGYVSKDPNQQKLKLEE